MTKKFFSEIFALKFTPWYRWHPNIALRYLPVAEWIRRQQSTINNQQSTILEVGSGGLGIAPYLKMPVTGVDREFEPPFHPMLKRVKGDATDLKFGDNSFDVVISMDMLEHLPKGKRGKAIAEMVRIARLTVIVGVPCGKEAEEHDLKIRDDCIRRRSAGYKFADEHIKLGLPEGIDILHYIKVAATELKKQIKIEIKGNMNLRLRSFLMWGWMSGNIFVDILFRKAFLLIVPIFRWFDKPPYYRKIFFITIFE